MSALPAPVLQTSLAIDSILSAIPNPVIGIDGQGIIRLCNEAMLDLLSSRREDVLGRSIVECIEGSRLPDILQSGQEETWRRFFVGGRAFLVSRAPLYIDGQMAGALASLHEISDLENISSELKSFRLLTEELEGIIEVAFDGIYVTDGQGVTLRINESYQRITGLKPHEVIGYSMYELVERGVFDQSVTINVLESGKPCSVIQAIRSGVTVLASANPLYDSTGKIVRVVTAVRDLTELNRLQDELTQAEHLKNQYEEELKKLRRNTTDSPEIIARSAPMRAVLDMASRVSSVDSTVLILGESGVGKEVIATFIHKHSQRSDKPFIKINCTAIPEQLLESELFGYVRGAFTGAVREGKAGLFEAAGGGTLLLDEIGDLPLGLQAKLLRVIQEKQTRRIGSNTPRDVDVRLLAATNRDLSERVAQKLFREDLYYRLNVVPIQVPPLRGRKEDILLMIPAFLEKYCKRHNRRRDLHPTVIPRLLDYPWPGNVRELENIMERLVVTAPGTTITLRDLPPFLRKQKPAPAGGITLPTDSLKSAVEQFESAILKEALARYRTTREVAGALAVNQSTVVRKARAYGLKLRGARRSGDLHS
ncbi:MAG: sigma 54-interacting transcriptional regulator [Desulfovibrio sp.]|jgi:PAS domain S-box-containing protein|nr:sigma 54-interacting transcriptional regulator [Desulfovibrio sp.]